MRASEKAYQNLHEDIVAWRLLPGTVLAEVELSERLGVSRTPVREALSRLTAEGLTTAKGGRGVVVTEVSLETVRELYELRETLEAKAAALAAERGHGEVFSELQKRFELAHENLASGKSIEEYYRLSGDLDAALDEHCGNPFLVSTLKNLRPLLARARRMAQEHPRRLEATAAEHASICAAVAAGNPHLAAATTTVHLSNSLQHILDSNPPQTEEDQN
ncbi:DNA-binding GntR family transcriptional regulator [Psychromicrobium silvestre]|uniref:DNA-binding GntR family transcriptional regulator n=1 Tax=Psychromicrobium silvestre TaxID=1645614 RepID=A0A7Y9LQQ6_9MICC|nr:GntR family transcriptional regulator [Psychromicrobium silvestre]NYE93848.1 DNA-binding GntR family transcriptional regulator [Psychromicrobium silvestre]